MGVVAGIAVYYGLFYGTTVYASTAMLAGAVVGAAVATQTDAGWVGEGNPEVQTPDPITTTAIDKTSGQDEEELDEAKIGNSSGKKTKRASFSTDLAAPVADDSGLQIGGSTGSTPTGTPTSGAGVRL